jgi:N-acetylglucosamine kinase-like BadF-type ATPase
MNLTVSQEHQPPYILGLDIGGTKTAFILGL